MLGCAYCARCAMHAVRAVCAVCALCAMYVLCLGGVARTALGHRRRRGARGGGRGRGVGDRLGWGHLRILSRRLYKDPKDFTKPQNSIQRHKILHKDLNYYTFDLKS